MATRPGLKLDVLRGLSVRLTLPPPIKQRDLQSPAVPYADPEAQRRYQREWMARRRREWLDENGPCVDCGSWEELEVDHVDPATKTTHAVWSWSAARREAELAKCVVRCHDCHAAKTAANHEHTRGESHGRAKLCERDVREIRSLARSGCTLRELATMFGISRSSVHEVVVRETWAHVA